MAKKKVHLHTKIHDYIIDYISELKPGTMLPTELELASKFNVSRLTVHKVMANLQRDGIVHRVKGRGTFLSSETKEILKLGPGKRHGTAIMAFPDWFSEDIFYKVAVAERVANQKKMDLLNVKLSPSPDYGILRSLLAEHDNVKGILLIPPGAEMNLESLKVLDSLGVPVVISVPVEDYVAFENIHVVTVDHFEIGYLGVDYLVRKGHRKIAHIPNEPWTYSTRQILSGMKRALQTNGLKVSNLIGPKKTIVPGEDSMKSGYDFTRDVIEMHQDVTAMVYDSLPGVIGGKRYLDEQGIAVPDEISLISNADYGHFEDYLFPSITSVTANREMVVAKGFDVILDEDMRAQKTLLINCSIEERESVRPPA